MQEFVTEICMFEPKREVNERKSGEQERKHNVKIMWVFHFFAAHFKW